MRTDAVTVPLKTWLCHLSKACTSKVLSYFLGIAKGNLAASQIANFTIYVLIQGMPYKVCLSPDF